MTKQSQLALPVVSSAKTPDDPKPGTAPVAQQPK
jgi:hypothetical protein